MANFPTSLDSLTNPTANDTLAAVPHHTQHGTANDILEALEAKVGIGSSTPAQGKVLRSSATGSSAWVTSGHVNVLDHGAVADGVTDSSTAFAAAFTAASSAGVAVYAPSGRYHFTTSGLSLPTGDVELFGDGPLSTVLTYEEDAAGGSWGLLKDTQSLDATLPRGHLYIHDLGITGSWGTLYGSLANAIFVNSRKSVTVERCRFYAIAGQGMSIRMAGAVRVLSCDFERIAADCVFVRHGYNVQIIGNRAKNTDDDVFAVHQGNSELSAAGMTAEGAVIADNICEDTCSIVCLGGRVIDIHDNILRRPKKAGITVSADPDAPYLESDAVQFSVRVAGNIIHDALQRPPFSTAASYGIRITGPVAKGDTDSGGIVPGQNNTGTGAIVEPYAYRENRYNTSGEATPPVWHVQVVNNEIRRTLPAVSAYSDWGFGEVFHRDQWYDLALTEANLRVVQGISIANDPRFVTVSGNHVECVQSGFESAVASDFTLDGSEISGNLFRDFYRGVYITGTGSPSLRVVDNRFDGDPYHTWTNRGTLGTYLADNGLPTALECTSAKGVTFAGNRVKNVCNVVRAGSYVDVRGNVLQCDPVTIGGFSTSNKGIGNVPTLGVGYILMTTDSDPTSATFGNVSGKTHLMPITGSLWLPASAMHPSTTNGATAVAQTEMATNKQNIRYLAFPDAATRYAETAVGMPDDWDGGTFTAKFHWTCTASGFFQVVWQVEARSYGDDESIDAAWGTAISKTIAQGSSASQVQSGTTIAVTPAGTPAAGELLLLRVARLGSDGSDNLAQDALLLGVRIDYARKLVLT